MRKRHKLVSAELYPLHWVNAISFHFIFIWFTTHIIYLTKHNLRTEKFCGEEAAIEQTNRTQALIRWLISLFAELAQLACTREANKQTNFHKEVKVNLPHIHYTELMQFHFISFLFDSPHISFILQSITYVLRNFVVRKPQSNKLTEHRR